MPRDGAGVYSLPDGYLASTGQPILPSQHNAPLEDMAAALTQSISRTGVTAIAADIPFGEFKITGLGVATTGGDALSQDAGDARYTPRVETKTANYTMLAADIGSLIVGTGTWQLSLLATATAGNGYSFRVKNTGTGVITIDANASETIDGATTFAVQAGQEIHIICTGTAWVTVGQTLWKRLGRVNPGSGGAGNVIMAIPSGTRSIRIQGRVKVMLGQYLVLRLSVDGGANFLAGATDYVFSVTQQNTATIDASAGTGASYFYLSDISDNAARQSTTTFATMSLGDVTENTTIDVRTSRFLTASNKGVVEFTQYSNFGGVITHIQFVASSGSILEGTDIGVEYL